MKIAKNLKYVNAKSIPSKVLVLLAKYAQAVRQHDGVILKLNSNELFQHVDQTYARSNHPQVRMCYKYLVVEVNRQLAEGNMKLIEADKTTDSRDINFDASGKPENSDRFNADNTDSKDKISKDKFLQ